MKTLLIALGLTAAAATLATPAHAVYLRDCLRGAPCPGFFVVRAPALGRVVGVTARRWRRLAGPLFDPYRPELYYMRGPGPKWREKHAQDVSY
jgi:hypothetical protein